MNRAANLAAVLAFLALTPMSIIAGAASADSARPAALPTRPAAALLPVSQVKAASSAVLTTTPESPKARVVKEAALQPAPAAPTKPGATTPVPVTEPAPTTATRPPAATPGTADQPRPNPTPARAPDSVQVRMFKVENRPHSEKEAKKLQSVLNFKPKGKPESTGVSWVYRDERGARLAFVMGKSEWSFAYDTVAALDPKEYLDDSLIRTVTDRRLKEFLGGKMDQYAFVNYEKTLFQAKVPKGKAPAPLVPAYYVGRYLRKLGGRHVLGENFQVRVGVGRANAVNLISYREPVLKDSSMKVMVPTKELVQAYLDKWARDRRRLGRQYYPYHPDSLRIRSLKPIYVFESYVQVPVKFRENPSKSGLYLSPKVTVLAEVSLYPSRKKSILPAPNAPIHLHFHFPCTPQAGLCWPDGKQGIQDEPQANIGPRAAQTPAGSVPTPLKSGTGAVNAAPAGTPASNDPAVPVPAPAP